MPWKDSPEFWDIIGALIVSFISGFVSIARRILNGQKASLLWVVTEFFTAILCGYLMYVSYPALADLVPKWFTLPVAVALAAHIGGRVFQEAEKSIITQLSSLTRNT